MKKFVITFICATLLTGTAWAKCDGGEVFTWNSHEYCNSLNTMTWWSGFSWCLANERHVAKWNEVCEGCLFSKAVKVSSIHYWDFWLADPFDESTSYSLPPGYGNAAAPTTSSRLSEKRVLCY